MSNWFKATLCAALVCVAPPAWASESLAGEWVFRAVHEEFGCIINGQATLTQIENDAYDVALRAAEICGGEKTTITTEACTATRNAGIVSVSCRIVHSTSPSYLPDDFILTESGPDLMVGRLTANWNAPAEWRRARAVPVS